MLNRKVNETGGKKFMRKVKSKWVAVAAVGILAGIVAPSSASAWTARSVAEISQDVWETETPAGLNGYLINWGDTLWGLSRATGYSVMDFTSTFGIENADLIYAGDTLKVASEETATDADGFYTVVAGDTLSAIAPVFNTTVGQLVAWNNISNPDLIFPGQVLRVTAPTSATETTEETVSEDAVVENNETPTESTDEEDGGNFTPVTPSNPESPTQDEDVAADEDESVDEEDDDFGNFTPVDPEDESDEDEDVVEDEDIDEDEDVIEDEDIDEDEDDDVDYQPELPEYDDEEEDDVEEEEETSGPDDISYMIDAFDWANSSNSYTGYTVDPEFANYYSFGFDMSDVWLAEQGLTTEEAYPLAMAWLDEATEYIMSQGYDVPVEWQAMPTITEYGDITFAVLFR